MIDPESASRTRYNEALAELTEAKASIAKTKARAEAARLQREFGELAFDAGQPTDALASLAARVKEASEALEEADALAAQAKEAESAARGKAWIARETYLKAQDELLRFAAGEAAEFDQADTNARPPCNTEFRAAL